MSIIELPDIVQSLQNKQWTGTLEIFTNDTKERRSTALFFQNGMIQHCAPDRNPLVLGRALFDLGQIDEADYVMTMVDYEQTGRRVGEVLIELGLVDDGGIRKALTHQGKEHVLDVFNWQNVDVKFHAGDEMLEEKFSSQQREVNLNLAGMSILMEAARRSDEWGIVNAVIPSEHDVIASTSEEGLPEGEIDRRVALLIDCYRSAWEVATQAPMNTLEVLMMLAELVKQGHLKCLEPPELAKVGLVAEQDEDHEKALRVYELAAERGLDHLDLHRRVARILTLLGRNEDALQKWVEVADRCTKLERTDVAISAIKDAIELDAENLGLRKKLVTLLVETEKMEEAAQALRPLIDMASSQGAEASDLSELMGQYLEYMPEDQEILERQSQVHLELDNPLDAMVCLDDLATVLLQEEKQEEAIAVYYRILDIDNENLQARLLLAQNLAKMGSTDDAVREYRKLADILYRSGVIGNTMNWAFLIKVYESIVELEPSATEAWDWLAKAYIENEKPELAISRYLGMADSLVPPEGDRPPPEMLGPLRHVVKLDPKRLDVRRRLAHTYLALGQVERAVEALRKLAEQALEDGEVDQARIAYDEGLEHQPFDMDSRRGLAAIHEQLDEFEEAFAAWREIGVMCHLAGLLEEAGKDLHRAFKIRDDDPRTVWTLAEVEEARGMDKNSAMLFVRFAQLEMAKNNSGRARDALERASRLEPNLPQVAQLMSKLTAAR